MDAFSLSLIYEEAVRFLSTDPNVYGGRLSIETCLFLNIAGFFSFYLIEQLTHSMFLFFSQKYSKLTVSGQMELIQNAVNLVTVLLLGPLYTLAAIETRLTAETRWEKPNYWGQIALLIHCASTIYDLYLYVRYFNKGPELYLHHVLILGNYLPTLVTGHLCHWAYWDGTVEFTNVFLCYVYIARILECRNNIFFPIMGGLLLISFIVIRIVGMSWWLYQWAVDYNESYEYFSRNKSIAKYTAFPTTFFLLSLSAYWLIPITKGFLKAIGVIKPKPKSE